MHEPITTKIVKLEEIDCTTDTQVRAKLNPETVSEYAAAMTERNTFPHPVCYCVGERYVLADGFHRVQAAKNIGRTELRVEVHHGTKADALKYALSANATHGLPRTNADKRRSVELALQQWPKLSDAELGRICAVSHPFVATVRREVQPVTVTGCRIGKDGRERRVRVPVTEPNTTETTTVKTVVVDDINLPRIVTATEELRDEPKIEYLDAKRAAEIAISALMRVSINDPNLDEQLNRVAGTIKAMRHIGRRGDG